MIQFPYDFFDFIKQYSDQDPLKLRLALDKTSNSFDTELAITQIECRKKYNSKLKEILKEDKFLFPDSISGEQASHQAVAKYHASLVKNYTSVLDITAGLGIDSIYMAKAGANVTAIELNLQKAKILNYNAHILGLQNLKVTNDDSISFLKTTDEKFDLIFCDPARRDASNKRVYNLHDCSPDILENQNLLLSKAEKVIIKASPLLDISQTIKDFPKIESIQVIGVKGECKEVLITINEKFCGSNANHIKIESINLDIDGNVISFFSDYFNSEGEGISFASIEDIKPGYFILEPSAMIMKIAPWQKIASTFKAKKLGNSSHIFISQFLPESFPGRVTKIKEILKKDSRKTLVGFHATVVSRNYPLSSEQLRKSLRLKEGDQNFIYATRLKEKPMLILSSAI